MDRDLLYAVQKRIPFQQARKMLVQNGFPTGLGWDDIYQKLNDKSAQASADVAGLYDAYLETLIASQKAMHTYKIKDADANAIRNQISSLSIPSNVFSKRFPYILSNAEIKNTAAGPPKLAGQIDLVDGTALIFCSIRELELRDEIKTNLIPKTLRDNYTKVIGVKIERHQTFDVVLIPKTGGTVKMLTDAPSGVNGQAISGSLFSIRTAMNSFAGAKLFHKPINLYPTIRPFYNSNEGIVQRLGYSTTTSSIKSEKMRGAGKCLRTELFHKSGMAALNKSDFQTFEIQLAWELPSKDRFKTRPELGVFGSYRMTYATNPIVSVATVSKCLTYDEFNFVAGKLMLAVSGKI
ncbi:hypothetical protein [Parasphingorhabdus sp.]|uniref:hypothetical protein n=1 Tax=Parasphingorhabdus sp. TaxID=2709688 RepID=UPI003D2B87CE